MYAIQSCTQSNGIEWIVACIGECALHVYACVFLYGICVCERSRTRMYVFHRALNRKPLLVGASTCMSYRHAAATARYEYIHTTYCDITHILALSVQFSTVDKNVRINSYARTASHTSMFTYCQCCFFFFFVRISILIMFGFYSCHQFVYALFPNRRIFHILFWIWKQYPLPIKYGHDVYYCENHQPNDLINIWMNTQTHATHTIPKSFMHVRMYECTLYRKSIIWDQWLRKQKKQEGERASKIIGREKF